jgi:hypothetical protein
LGFVLCSFIFISNNQIFIQKWLLYFIFLKLVFFYLLLSRSLRLLSFLKSLNLCESMFYPHSLK